MRLEKIQREGETERQIDTKSFKEEDRGGDTEREKVSEIVADRDSLHPRTWRKSRVRKTGKGEKKDPTFELGKILQRGNVGEKRNKGEKKEGRKGDPTVRL